MSKSPPLISPIESPKKTIDSLHFTVSQLKEAVEVMSGLRTAGSVGSPRSFFATTAPGVSQQLKDGDQWFDTSNQHKLYVWHNGAWVPTT